MHIQLFFFYYSISLILLHLVNLLDFIYMSFLFIDLIWMLFFLYIYSNQYPSSSKAISIMHEILLAYTFFSPTLMR